MLKPILEAWSSMIVRRWHAHDVMSNTTDLTGAHASRVCVLALRLNPKLSRRGIIYALTHDIGEKRAGDFPYTFKRDNPETAAKLGVYEEQVAAELGFGWGDLDPTEKQLVGMCDWIDSYLWAALHYPHIVNEEAWINQRAVCQLTASKLGLRDEIKTLMRRP